MPNWIKTKWKTASVYDTLHHILNQFRVVTGKVICRRFFCGLGLVLSVVCFLLWQQRRSLIPDQSSRLRLDCASAHRLAEWAAQKYGGHHSPRLRSEKFATKLLENFLGKLDPHRVLLTQEDLSAFKGGGRAAWHEFLRKERCTYFERWVRNEYPRLRARFLENASQTIQRLDFRNKVVVQQFSKPSVDKSFANTTAELKIRAKSFVHASIVPMPPEVLRAYDNNESKYYSDVIEPMLFEKDPEPPDPIVLLVKALLVSFDRYSTYFSSNEFEDFYEELAGGTSGVGLVVRKIPQGLFIEKVVSGSPAETSGQLKRADILVSVDGISLSDLPLPLAKSLLKGEKDSKVHLERVRGREKQSIVISRKNFAFDEARMNYKMVTSSDSPSLHVAVFEVPTFYGRGGMANTDERSLSHDMEKMLSEILSKRVRPAALLLDLRNNPGGYLEEAVAMGGLFLGDKPAVAVVENHGMRVLRDTRRRPVFEGPIVLLVDENSASASEVLAGAFKDYQRAILVGGSRTYGKMSIQRLFRLDEVMSVTHLTGPKTGVVKLTTSLFYSPLGKCQLGGGISTHLRISEEPPEQSSEFEPEAVPDIPTFMAEEEETHIRREEAKFQKIIARLHEKTLNRRQSRVKTPAGKDLMENKIENLNEAIAIAFDYAAL